MSSEKNFDPLDFLLAFFAGIVLVLVLNAASNDGDVREFEGQRYVAICEERVGSPNWGTDCPWFLVGPEVEFGETVDAVED